MLTKSLFFISLIGTLQASQAPYPIKVEQGAPVPSAQPAPVTVDMKTLHRLADANRFALIRSCIESHEDFFNAHPQWINEQDDQGDTILHRAFAAGHLGCFTYLLARGADYTKKNSGGQSVQDAVKGSPFEAVLQKKINGMSLEIKPNPVSASTRFPLRVSTVSTVASAAAAQAEAERARIAAGIQKSIKDSQDFIAQMHRDREDARAQTNRILGLPPTTGIVSQPSQAATQKKQSFFTPVVTGVCLGLATVAVGAVIWQIAGAYSQRKKENPS